MHEGPFGAGMVHWLGVGYATVLPTAATGGAMAIVYSQAPAGAGPPRHVHHREDETFVILEGRARFWMDGETSERGAGESVFIPRGAEHAFLPLTPFRHLLILTPGGFEGFFADMARGQFRIPQDMEQVTQSAARHHLSFTGPPLAP